MHNPREYPRAGEYVVRVFAGSFVDNALVVKSAKRDCHLRRIQVESGGSSPPRSPCLLSSPLPVVILRSEGSGSSRPFLPSCVCPRGARARASRNGARRPVVGDFDAWYGNSRNTVGDREDTARCDRYVASCRSSSARDHLFTWLLRSYPSAIPGTRWTSRRREREREKARARARERDKKRHAWQSRNQSSRLLADDAETRIMRTYVCHALVAAA